MLNSVWHSLSILKTEVIIDLQFSVITDKKNDALNEFTKSLRGKRLFQTAKKVACLAESSLGGEIKVDEIVDGIVHRTFVEANYKKEDKQYEVRVWSFHTVQNVYRKGVIAMLFSAAFLAALNSIRGATFAKSFALGGMFVAAKTVTDCMFEKTMLQYLDDTERSLKNIPSPKHSSSW